VILRLISMITAWRYKSIRCWSTGHRGWWRWTHNRTLRF